MSGKKFGLYRDPIGEIGLQNRGDARVKLLAVAAQQTAVGCVFDKRVLEEVGRTGRRAAAEDEACIAKPAQSVQEFSVATLGHRR